MSKKIPVITQEQSDQMIQEFIKHLREFFKEEIDIAVREEVNKQIGRYFRELGRR